MIPFIKDCYKTLINFEYWPMKIFYIPVYIYFLYLSLQARSLTFFSVTNPDILLGGLAGYDKYKILKAFDAEIIPQTFLFSKDVNPEKINQCMEDNNISFPCILKPNKGERGRGVEKIKTYQEIIHYMSSAEEDIILQEYTSLPYEFSIFYIRIPGEKNGSITSITKRHFLTITGDGISNMKTLIQEHPRARLYAEDLFQKHKKSLFNVLKMHEKKILVYIGNHSRGTEFENAFHLHTPQLEETFDKISKQVNNFFYGRYDLKVASVADLYKGNVQIMELNGVNSEPTHIYEPHYNIIQAYKDIFWHWNKIFEIAKINHSNGVPYTSFKKTWKIIKQYL